jgi:tetratricopeptide (TPR) repeat protein
MSPSLSTPNETAIHGDRVHRRLLLALVATACLSSCSPSGEVPEIVRPESLERLDPPVRELIEEHLAKAQTEPLAAASHGNLGLVYEANLLWGEAERSYTLAVRLAPDELGWKLHRAIAARQSGGFDRAIEIYRSLAQEHPGVPAVQQRLGESLLELGDLRGAEAAFRELIAVAPDAPQGYSGLGDVLIRNGDSEAAIELLERAVEIAPGYRMAQYLLGDAYRRQGRTEEAELALARGVDASVWYLADPLTAEVQSYAVNLAARLDRAGRLLNQGLAEEATAILEQARSEHPDNVTVLNNLAIAQMRTGRLAEAEEQLTAAVGIDPARFSTYLNLSVLAQRRGQLDSALLHTEEAVARAPDHDQTHFARGQILARMGRFEASLASLDRARELNASKPAYHSFSGDLCLRLARPEEALDHFERALEIDVGWFPAWVGTGLAQLELGRVEEARVAATEAARLAPGHPALSGLEARLEETAPPR